MALVTNLAKRAIQEVVRPGKARYSQRLISSSARTCIAQVTQPAPDFKGTAVVDGEFKELSLIDFAGKYLVLFFYPLDFSFLCPTELTTLEDKIDEFQAINASVVAVSTDSRFSHLASVNTSRKNYGLGNVRFPLLSDFCKEMSKDYGVLIEQAGVALRGTFIIDTNGIVRHLSVNDFSVGRSVDETLRLVQAFQFADKHGELCPSTWTPGAKSIKPSVEGSSEYFKDLD